VIGATVLEPSTLTVPEGSAAGLLLQNAAKQTIVTRLKFPFFNIIFLQKILSLDQQLCLGVHFFKRLKKT